MADHIVVSRVAQEKKHTVKGNVVDETGLPLPGVSVIIKGTTVGVATDADGNFQLEIAKLEGVILQFSMVGMKPQEVKIVPNRLSYNVVMQTNAQELEDVVCTGYQTLKKVHALLFSTISPKAIELRGSAGLNRLLCRKVPSLTIYNNDVRHEVEVPFQKMK
ncbi:MAG: carboxypeptidase-like regulatory domain-containing protein [Butyricimonas faecihominis]